MHEKKQWIALLIAAVLAVSGLSAFRTADADGFSTEWSETTTSYYEEGTSAYVEESTPAVDTFTVTYTDGLGGTVFADYVIPGLFYGDLPPFWPFETPTRDGWVFDGWDPEPVGNITGSTVYTAVWKADEDGNGIADEYQDLTFTVTYRDGADGSVFADVVIPDVPYGTPAPEYPNTPPTREGFTFLGFEPAASSSVRSDEVYTAVWREDLQLLSLSAEDAEYYLDTAGEEQRFQPQNLTVGTNYGTFSGTAEEILFSLRWETGQNELNVPYGIRDLNELTWTPGTHQVTFFFGDLTADYTVIVKEALIRDLAVSDLTFYADGSADAILPEEYAPKQITVTLESGTVLSGSPDDVAWQFYSECGAFPEYRLEGAADPLPFTVGEYPFTYRFAGHTADYKVIVLDMSEYPLTALTVEDFYVFAEYLPVEKYLPAYDNPRSVTVRLKDGSSISGSPEEVSSALSAEYGISCSYGIRTNTFPFEEMDREAACGDYVNTYFFGALEASYTIHVTMLIQKLEHVQLRFILSETEGTLDPADFFVRTEGRICPPFVRVTLFDDSTMSGFPEDVQSTLNDTYCNSGMGTLRLWGDLVYDESWAPGTYVHPFEFMRHYATVTIYVEKPDDVGIDTQMNYLTAAGEDENTPCDVTVDRRTNATDLLALLQAREEE